MPQLQNQFIQTTEQGVMDLRINPTVMSCVVDSASAALIPGQAVKMVDSAGGAPKVTAVAADTDDIFGFVTFDIRHATYAPGEAVEIAFGAGSVMYMTSSAAVARNAQVMVLVAGSKVLTAAGSGKRVVGRAIDKAAGANALIRVYINLPGATLP